MTALNSRAEQFLATHHRTASEAHALGKQLDERMGKRGTSENDLLQMLQTAEPAVMDHVHNFVCLIPAGMSKAFDYVLETHWANREADREWMAAINDPEKLKGLEINNLHLIMHSIVGSASHSQHNHYKGPKPTDDELTARVLAAADKVIAHAGKQGIAASAIIDLSDTAAQQNWPLVGPLLQRSGEFAKTHAREESRWLRGDQYHQLHFFDTYAAVTRDGTQPYTLGYGLQPYQAMSQLAFSPVVAFNAACTEGHFDEARSVIATSDIRPTFCAHMAGIALQYAPELVEPLLAVTKCFNRANLAGYLIARAVPGGLIARDDAQYNAGREQRVLGALDHLIAQGGDINTDNAGILVHVATVGRMDLAQPLIDRGASLAQARAEARNAAYSNNEQGIGWNQRYPEADKRLRNFRTRAKARPA